MPEQQEDIPFQIAENAKQVYMTGAFGGFTPYDFRIMIYNEVVGLKGELIRESEYQLVMSPLAAKELRDWLDNNIKIYEDKIGPILMPKVDKDD